MRWSRSRHRLAMKLQEIERSRRKAAEARLAAANSKAADARCARAGAQEAVAEAERGWEAQLGGQAFNLELVAVHAARLLDRQGELREREDIEGRAERAADRERLAWQDIEAAVRCGEINLRRGRRALARRSEEMRDRELSDRTAWKWFHR